MQKKMENRRRQSGQSAPSGAAPEPPLVDQMAELRMIRSLQSRVNRQTERYRGLLEKSPSDPIDLRAAVRRLAERQRRIHQATRNLSRELSR
jgi:hypothetical protein